MAAVSSRYARAFADVVTAHKLDAASTLSALEQLGSVLGQSSDLRNLWDSPSVPQPQKIKVLDAIAKQSGFAPQLRNFIAVLITQRRIRLLDEITALVKSELNERMGFAEAEVTSARELTPEERSTLEAQVAKATGKTIRAKYERDPKILGGAVVKVGSTVFDGSVKGKLERIRRQMVGST